ncbi:MAG: DUF91 domain-containing protein [Burkholderiales bacterium]|nr:DUF91 domain-containing protein [Burkholderiales bacterium]
MAIQHAIWKVGDMPAPLATSRLASEQMLEDMIVRDPRILSSEWMLIGRQERTSFGGVIDLLALAPDGSLVLIELKRDKTPREIVAQALDYASWVEGLQAVHIAQIFQRFAPGANLNLAFKQKFGLELDEETLNLSHEIVIVAAELDAVTERIIRYLNEKDIAINAVFFQVFQNGADQLLSRAWMIDPIETQGNASASPARSGETEPWNGEFYASFGPAERRSWDDARKFGYISAGDGSWYSRTLGLLNPGDRVWVKIPGTGYVGVGRVLERMMPVAEFMHEAPEGLRPVLPELKHAGQYSPKMNDEELSEYIVRVQWLDTVDESKAVNEVGLFGNQNTVCQPTAAKWRHTVERLKTFFPKWDS